MHAIRRISVSELPGLQEAQREPCYLYVLSEDGSHYYKIGIAGHPIRRLCMLRSGNPRKISIIYAYAGAKSACLHVEKTALRYFGSGPRGEWVHTPDVRDITAFIDAFCEEK